MVRSRRIARHSRRVASVATGAPREASVRRGVARRARRARARRAHRRARSPRISRSRARRRRRHDRGDRARIAPASSRCAPAGRRRGVDRAVEDRDAYARRAGRRRCVEVDAARPTAARAIRKRSPTRSRSSLTRSRRPQVADNLIWSLADLDAHELGNPEAARAYYDRIPADYPDSGLRDDARWFGAQLSRAARRLAGAVQRLRALLATREVVVRHRQLLLDLARRRAARSSARSCATTCTTLPARSPRFASCRRITPASILRDDALYELEVTFRAGRRSQPACVARSPR